MVKRRIWSKMLAKNIFVEKKDFENILVQGKFQSQKDFLVQNLFGPEKSKSLSNSVNQVGKNLVKKQYLDKVILVNKIGKK